MKNNTILSEVPNPLLDWYYHNARILPWRDETHPYRIWVSEIMLQQTRVETVKPYFERWIRELPTLKDLAEASEEQLLLLWQGLGYYSRVRNLQKAAQAIIKNYDGQFPSSEKDLLSLPGIGEYTAGAILSIAFQQPVPCVDGNVLRVVSRLLAFEGDISKATVKASVTEMVRDIIPASSPGDFNQALMELGATVCLPNGKPECEKCPVKHLCEAFRTNTVFQYPVKKEKKARTIEPKTVFIFIKNNRIAIRKRNSEGLLSGMWEFPHLEGVIPENQIDGVLSQWGIKSEKRMRLKDTKHIFTHKEWHMTGYLIFVEAWEKMDSDVIWIDPCELNTKYALPTAFRPFIEAIHYYFNHQML